jgi:probable rRNA maturation factor
VDVNVTNTQTDLNICEETISQIAEAVISLQNHTCHEVNFYFVTKKEICDLHERYFGDPSFTDCISFPMDSPSEKGYRILGEVFICPQAAIEYVQEDQGNPYLELTLYIVHGLLHLMGYDDIKETDQQQMQAAEQKCMLYLHEKNMTLKHVEKFKKLI